MFCQWFPSDFLHVHNIVSPHKMASEALLGGHPAGHAVHLGWGHRSLAAPQLDQWDSNGIPVNISRKFGKILEDGVDHFIVEIPISMVQFFMVSGHRTHSNLNIFLSWPYQLFHGPIFHMFPPCLGCLRFLDSHKLRHAPYPTSSWGTFVRQSSLSPASLCNLAQGKICFAGNHETWGSFNHWEWGCELEKDRLGYLEFRAW